MNDEPIDNNGGRRLATLGIVSILIAFITSGISLFLYTSSGDIYLDRSRPGFIFDDESPKDTEEAKQTAIFPPDGPITKEAISDYLKKLDALVKDISSDPTAFSSDALSDEALNIDGSVDD